MQDDHRHQEDAEDPDEAARRKRRRQDVALEPLCVLIELFSTKEHLEVAIHVHQQESDEDQSGDGHRGLHRN